MDRVEEKKRIAEDREWIASLSWTIEHEHPDRVRDLLRLLLKEARLHRIELPDTKLTGDYINSILSSEQREYPGNLEIEQSLYAAVRWNAMAMVVNANRRESGIGGHISTYSSLSRLLEVGFNHFFKGYDMDQPDLVYVQGHASPGLYARSFVEHRLEPNHLDHFRRELAKDGLTSYPHPHAMPDYWRYPTVSMGLSMIQAVYKARFIKYLENRNLIPKKNQKVWVFAGDGEMDEPESRGALSLAVREKLDNLIVVINGNLQRLDGPVRGNRNILVELESLFRGVGWNVLKVLWGSGWDPLLEKDEDRKLIHRLNELRDGELQKFSSGRSWDELFRDESGDRKPGDQTELIPGGHDPVKIYNAYYRAFHTTGKPSVILAQTVKGYEQGEAGEASNVTHKQKVMDSGELDAFRERIGLDRELDLSGDDVPYFRFEKDSAEYKYLVEQRQSLQGWLPNRRNLAKPLSMPSESVFQPYEEGSSGKETTTTSVMVRILRDLLKDEATAGRVIPIIPDESRTFGMDALFREFGIYASEGQKYAPVDEDSLLYYNESRKGILLEEGITEAGSMSSFIAAGTSHIDQPEYCIPFYFFYSMFGFQRIGDLIWAAGDAGARGFLVGGISGRTTLSGEGLQHADGQSHLFALAYPNVRAYDPAFAYEAALIVKEGIREMYVEEKDVCYYLTMTNAKYMMPPLPAEYAREGVLKGLYSFHISRKRKHRELLVNLMGSGALMEEVRLAADFLENEMQIPVNIWSVTSYKSLYDDAIASRQEDRPAYLENTLKDQGEIFVAVSDYVRALPLSVAPWIPGTYRVLGTDGFGISDTIPALRRHFRVDALHIVQEAIEVLVEKGLTDRPENLEDKLTSYLSAPDN